jgi:hypothetical protein
MAKGKSNLIFWIVGSAILIGGGVGAYFLLRKKGKKEDDIFREDEKLPESSPTPVMSTRPTGTTSLGVPMELDSKDKIKQFQRFVFYTMKDDSLKTTKVADGVDGIYESRTASAWGKYKNEFLSCLSNSICRKTLIGGTSSFDGDGVTNFEPTSSFIEFEPLN